MFPAGETVTLVSAAVTGTDEYGNDVRSPTSTDLDNCPVWPTTSSEQVEGRDTVTTGLTVVLPVGTPVAATDRLLVRGAEYEVHGAPERFQSPFTGFTPGLVVNLRRVTG